MQIFAINNPLLVIIISYFIRWNYRDIKLLNMMFDRSFSTTKVSYQNDFAIKRTTSHSKTVQNCSANNSDFIHGDELPNYVEIENEDDEEEEEYDWIIGRPTSEIN